MREQICGWIRKYCPGSGKQELQLSIAKEGDVVILESKKRLTEQEIQTLVDRCKRVHEKMGVAFVLLEDGVRISRMENPKRKSKAHIE